MQEMQRERGKGPTGVIVRSYARDRPCPSYRTGWRKSRAARARPREPVRREAQGKPSEKSQPCSGETPLDEPERTSTNSLPFTP